MHNLDPNDMDALFKEGADNHEFTYNPEAWALMEEKLDAKDRRKYILWLFLGLFLLASAFGLYQYTSYDDAQLEHTDNNIEIAQNDHTIINIENTETTTSKKENTNSEIGRENTEINTNETQNLESDIEEEYINTVSKVRSRNIGAQNSFQSENTGSLVNDKVVSISPPSNTTTSSASHSDPSISVVAKDNLDKNIVQNNNKTNSISLNDHTSTPKARKLTILEVLNMRKTITLQSLTERSIDFNLVPENAAILPIAMSSGQRFVLSAFASADYSSVGFFQDAQSGYSIGLKAGLQTARKYQFDVGLAYSLRKYGSVGEKYNIAGGWESMVGVDPIWMDGKGSIIQIPLEATYYINGYGNNSFFINAGVSSYIFNSEWYGFKYDQAELLTVPSPTPIVEITMEDINRHNFHLAGVGKIAIGYQRIISPTMAYEVSPYLQIPLTGIGEGKVDLYTAGIQFALKFNTK